MRETTVRKTFKEKLRPTPEQERALDAVLWRCRDLYNAAFEQRITAYQRRRVSVSRSDQEAELKDIREPFPAYAAIHSHIFQDVLARLDKTSQAFFRRVQQGEKAGFPRFKGRNRFHSFTFKEYGNGARLDNGSLVLVTIGRISMHWSRPLQGTPKTVTISQEADGCYRAISCAEAPVQLVPPTGQETGSALGIAACATLCEGTRILTPGDYRRAERYRAKCQRRSAKRGSYRRRKAVNLLAKAQQTVRRQRVDVHPKAALTLVRGHDVISHEDLQVRNMIRNHRLAKSISAAGWSAFLSMLTFKAACAGKRVVAGDPAFTSQTCSGCGVVVQQGLSVRWHACPDCGTSLHRDHNAAKTIHWRGQRLRGLAGAPAGVHREPAGL
jgi:putative transposase